MRSSETWILHASDGESAPVSDSLLEALDRLSQGDVGFRLPRTLSLDAADLAASRFNAIAAQLEQLKSKQERGNPVTALVGVVNNTVHELASLLVERQRKSEENFRRLFEAAPVALVMSRLPDTSVVAANPRAADLFGIPVAQLLSQHARDFWVHAQAREELVARVHEEGMVDAYEAELQRLDGRRFWGSVAARVLEFNGEQVLISGIWDVSHQRELSARLLSLATTDELTGALNRRRSLELAREELERAERYDRPVSLAMMDLDHFKAVNDQFGHAIGDEALREVVQVMRAQLRRPDWLARYGGEELAVLFPETTLEAAMRVTERIRLAVENLALMRGGKRVPLTLSAGVATWKKGESLEDFLRRSDTALYAAKDAGRNRVVAA